MAPCNCDNIFLPNAGFVAWKTAGGVDSAELILWTDDTLFVGYNAKYVSLRTNQLPRFNVNNDGNVGIGTTTPVNRLDVEGAVAIGAVYSGTNVAPPDGLMVQGSVAIGSAVPVPATTKLLLRSPSGRNLSFFEDPTAIRMKISTFDDSNALLGMHLVFSELWMGTPGRRAFDAAGQPLYA